jgi:phage terminase large subunit GpA-like protein
MLAVPDFHPDDYIAEAWNQGLLPDPEITVDEWADRYRKLSSKGGSAEAGPYRTSRTPYLREIFENLSVGSPVRRTVFKKAAQIGASECGMCWVGYIIDQVPGPTLVVQPTVDLAHRFSNQRVQPMIDDTVQLTGKVAEARSRSATNTVSMKDFRGGVLVLTGANSAVGLRSMPVRFLMLDEVDAYPGDLENEGDPIALAEARTRTFSFRSKIFLLSTPKLKNTSRICREFEATDQRYYHVPCPLCGREQVLQFPRLRWQPNRPDTVHYLCVACDRPFGEHHKTAMLAAGRWIPAVADFPDPTVRGYHLSALYSPLGWLSWAEIADQWIKSAEDPDRRKTFVNTVLGEEWEEEASPVPDWQRLYDRREEWAYRTVPLRGLFITAGADVQADRIEVDVWAWGRGLESWLVEHRVIFGDPGKRETWVGLTSMLGETWEHETGARMGLQRLAIDTGSFTQNVYLWARSQDRATVLPVKGVPQYDRLIPVSGPSKVELTPGGVRLRGGLNLWTVSVSVFKREFYKQLEQAKPTDEELERGVRYPAGYVHLSTAVSDEWVKQTVAEQQVLIRSRKGFAVKTEWRQLRPRNEALDMRVYARAAAWLAGMDRWSDRTWRDLEGQLGLEPEPPAGPPPAPHAVEATAGRINRRGVLGQRRPVRNLGNV